MPERWNQTKDLAYAEPIKHAEHPDFPGEVSLSICPVCGRASIDRWMPNGSGGYSSGCGGKEWSRHPTTDMIRYLARVSPEQLPGR